MRQKRHLLLELGVILLAVIVSVPLYLVLINAFKPHPEIVKHPLSFPRFEVGFDNMVNAFEKMDIVKAYGTTFAIGAVAMFIAVGLGALAAYAVSRLKHPFFSSMYWFYTACILIPIQSALIPLVLLLRDLHLQNSIFGISFIYGAMLAPFCIFMYSGFMRSIPYELEESAYLDGCSTFRTFFQIILPLILPVTASLIIVQFISVWNDLQLPLVLLNSVDHPTVSISLYKFFASRNMSDLSLLFGGIMLTLLPIMILFISFQRYFVKGLSTGAVKG
ncbi:carbohydrate ABC transporter permease [Cohnella fermenti]|uniref:Carbohydrate ABC transporter permease n=1 Tax=Cohnella fermenti TaxID=2565925 RepID=A0A4V3WEA3_9BACL|nr:carbohydrate ABC transporter permease [Cohnella fermenti]THF75508.1 carbohydrate ABC transporter permease [Cohnella fermenti]